MMPSSVILSIAYRFMGKLAPAVLIVDDDLADGDLLVRAIRKSGFENTVHVVPSVQQAKAYLQGDQAFSDRHQYPVPSLVILDHRIPESSGWEVLEWMREKPGLKNLPVVVFSGSGTSGDRERALELGAVFEIKPVRPDEYKTVVKRIGDFWLRGGLGVGYSEH
jgi:CheY-like chemotaxis protein